MPKKAPLSPSATDLTERERELLSVTIEVLAEYGYDRLTVDEIAARGRASKATIYRRWPSKAVLIIAAMAARVGGSAVAADDDGAPLRDALLRKVDALASEGRELRAIVASLVGEAVRNAELRNTIDEHFVAPRRDALHDMLEQRQAAGEIRAGLDIDFVGAVATAVIYQRLLITNEAVDDTITERIVDELLMPLLTSDPPPTSRSANQTNHATDDAA